MARYHRRGFESDHGVLLADVERLLGLGVRRFQAEPRCKAAIHLKTGVADDGERHALFDLFAEPLDERTLSACRNTAGEPGGDAGVAVAENLVGQWFLDIGVIDDVAHVVEWQLQVAVGVGVIQRGRFFAVVHDQYAARHGLDAPDADAF